MVPLSYNILIDYQGLISEIEKNISVLELAEGRDFQGSEDLLTVSIGHLKNLIREHKEQASKHQEDYFNDKTT